MTIIVAIVFGIVQGLTEFLPVSSSGHLAMLSAFFGLQEQALFTAVMLHVATFLSVCVVLRHEILMLLKKPFSPAAKKIYLASFISFGIVILIKGLVEKSFESLATLPFMFLLTAALLAASEFFAKNLFINKKIGYGRAAIIGFIQGLAALPGISRSGSTISAALFCKVEREEAANFSFLLSLPIIAASATWEGLKILKTPNAARTLFTKAEILPNIIAFLIAFVVGIFAIKIMRRFVKKAKMWYFSVYLCIVAILLFLC